MRFGIMHHPPWEPHRGQQTTYNEKSDDEDCEILIDTVWFCYHPEPINQKDNDRYYNDNGDPDTPAESSQLPHFLLSCVLFFKSPVCPGYT